ncbi:DUF5362 family protein [Flavobacterium sp. RHBU_3]|uniref:DUF5362 family protein n=1 Tax=Flavobacterium sp. RHBU_3 TaxID=3391184 RepID=UPI00398532FE
MEDFSTQSSFDSFELQLTQEAKDFVREAGKWARFLSIVGFVFIGFFVLMALFIMTLGSMGGAMGGAFSAMGAASGVFIGLVYILIALLYFFPVLYLFKFGNKTKAAFESNDTQALTEAFQNLKSHYKFVGILTIVGIGFYVLMIVIAVIAGVASAV